MLPIYVASKNRSQSSQTLKALKALPDWEKKQFWFVVEPQEYFDYVKVLPQSHLIILPDNDRGLAYARQFILDVAAIERLTWFWMLDDDLTGFFKQVSGKMQRIDLDVALSGAEQFFVSSNTIAQAGLEYQQFAWSQKKPYTMNGYCDCCVAIHAQRCKSLKFRDEVNLKLDRDFTLQVLSLGYDTLRTFKYAFSCPKNGSNAGGLQGVYQTDGEELRNSQRMCELWGAQVCKLNIKSDGRPDVKINWGYFKKLRAG